MNAVEIEQAVSALAEAPFEAATFPFDFLEAFGNKPTTLKRLKSGNSNQSDVENGILQRNNIHLATCAEGEVTATLAALRKSPTSAKQKAKFLLATDGLSLEAENLADGETLACDYPDFADHFGFFLPLAGITTVREIRENAFDIKATSRLNKLYLELLKDNPGWGQENSGHDMNHFMARLIFCFFAEDTDIFKRENLFTDTVVKMSTLDGSDCAQVIAEIFRAMNTKPELREAKKIRSWASPFPYVNGGLFGTSSVSNETATDEIPLVPRFSKIARSYLTHVGDLNWQKINPDIFGSMIQAVADEDERSALGMHYTSVPNILKVLGPLFLDELREKLAEAGDNTRKLLNLRRRIARLRVFDPACGSGNFLVIAYKQLREIEAIINGRRSEPELRSAIPLTNFRGIELRPFAAEIARLALIIAEYQCDVLYRGQMEALATLLPLSSENWVTCGNALRLDWLSICPPNGKAVKVHANDLFHTPLDQSEIDFEHEEGETFICGNPPYLGSTWQTKEQKNELKAIFEGRSKSWKSLDYVAGWFMKAADYGMKTPTVSAFVSTNSICQGQQVPILWPLIFDSGHEIAFAHTSFKWANLASHNAGVTVVIVGISNHAGLERRLFSLDEKRDPVVKSTGNINAYLINSANVNVVKRTTPLSLIDQMDYGNKPTDGGNLLLDAIDVKNLSISNLQESQFIRPFFGSAEYIRGMSRYCLWIKDQDLKIVLKIPTILSRINAVRDMRLASRKESTRKGAAFSHRFDEKRQEGGETVIAIPRVSSESRYYLPAGFLPPDSIVSDSAFALYDAPLWNMALIASRIHLVWIATVCGKLKTDFRYSNTLGWNTFPVPTLTRQNKEDLTRCAEDILLARERHFPATIADLYKPTAMPENLRQAHERNDETLERIYIGRRFKNDTERLEKLFQLYTKMTSEKR